jgi:intracellular sulfur oxidation DsrE/DsrF family protein
MDKQLTERRSFFMKLQVGAAGIAAALGGSAIAQAKSAKPGAKWEPARHEKDAWYAETPTKHRFVFDTTTPHGFGEALMFANNFLIANKNDYGLQSSDLAIIIVARHMSTPFAYNDAIWAKYGARLSSLASFEDPKAKAPVMKNLFNASGYGGQLPNRGVTVDELVQQGVHFAVCSMATRALSDMIAQPSGGDGASINGELVANLVSNARMVPAGIVAVNRAQEYGYSLVVSA